MNSSWQRRSYLSYLKKYYKKKQNKEANLPTQQNLPRFSFNRDHGGSFFIEFYKMLRVKRGS